MPLRDRRGAQLTVELPPELLARLRAYAAAADRPVTAVMRRWIEAGLSGALEGGAAAPEGADLVARLEALEAAVAAMARARPASPKRVSAPSPEQVSLLQEPGPALQEQPPAQGDPAAPPDPRAIATADLLSAAYRQLQAQGEPAPAAPPAGALTTAELAERTATNRAGWNNWAGKAAVGDVRSHPEAGSWRLVGKAPAPGGGPARWLWEPA